MKKQLIKLGKKNRALRPHIRKILAASREDQIKALQRTLEQFVKRHSDSRHSSVQYEANFDQFHGDIRSWDVAKEFEDQDMDNIYRVESDLYDSLERALKPYRDIIKGFDVYHGDKNYFNIGVSLK